MNDARAQSGVDTPASAPGVSPPTAASAPPDTPPSCPRCGYDLSGAAAAWSHAESTSCPMRGTCSECGLEFAWGDLLSPVFRPPAWSFEHAEMRRVSRLILTMFRSLTPGRVFAEIRLEIPVRAGRLVALTLASLVAWQLLASAAQVLALFDEYIIILDAAMRGRVGWSGVRYEVLSSLLPYAMAGGQSWSSIWVATPWTLLCVLWLLLTPLTFALLGQTLRRYRVRRVHLLRGVAYGVAPMWMLLSLTLVVPLGCAAWEHLAGGYSIWDWRQVRWLVEVMPLALVGVWQLNYVRRFVGGYLRLPNEIGVALVMMTLSFLAAATLVWLSPLGSLLGRRVGVVFFGAPF